MAIFLMVFHPEAGLSRFPEVGVPGGGFWAPPPGVVDPPGVDPDITAGRSRYLYTEYRSSDELNQLKMLIVHLLVRSPFQYVTKCLFLQPVPPLPDSLYQYCYLCSV